MQPDDLLKINANNAQGKPVPLSAFASTHWVTGAQQTVRYNGYPAMYADPGRTRRSTEARVNPSKFLRHCFQYWNS